MFLSWTSWWWWLYNFCCIFRGDGDDGDGIMMVMVMMLIIIKTWLSLRHLLQLDPFSGGKNWQNKNFDAFWRRQSIIHAKGKKVKKYFKNTHIVEGGENQVKMPNNLQQQGTGCKEEKLVIANIFFREELLVGNYLTPWDKIIVIPWLMAFVGQNNDWLLFWKYLDYWWRWVQGGLRGAWGNSVQISGLF